MFCSFESLPRILRFFCTGRLTEWDQPGFAAAMARMGDGMNIAGARAVIHLDVFKVQTSCGYGVPLLSLTTDPTTHEPKPSFQDRNTINHFNEKKTDAETHDYQKNNNFNSLDGLPGLRAARKSRGEMLWVGDAQNWLRRHRQTTDLLTVSLMSVVATIVVLQWAGLTTLEL